VAAGIGQFSSLLSFPPSSRPPAAGISTGCSDGGDAPVFGQPFPCTTSTRYPLNVEEGTREKMNQLNCLLI